jgi:Zn-finger protein
MIDAGTGTAGGFMTVDTVCFNCERSEAEVPIIHWRYQGGGIWVCSQCMPLLIHKLDEVKEALRLARAQEEADGGNV